MLVEGALTDLDSRGFVVVRQLVGDDEIGAAVKDARAKRDEPSRLEAYNVQSVAKNIVVAFQGACQSVLDQVRSQTRIRASEFSPGNSASYFYVNNRQTAQWHTDYLSYYLL